jgi:hypothetical protein
VSGLGWICISGCYGSATGVKRLAVESLYALRPGADILHSLVIFDADGTEE